MSAARLRRSARGPVQSEVDDATFARLEAAADARGVSVNQLIRELLMVGSERADDLLGPPPTDEEITHRR